MAQTTQKYIFSEILKKGSQRGIYPGKTQAAANWYRGQAQSFSNISRNRLLGERSQMRNSIVPGSMYMFAYSAKYKDTLPYYDAFPIIFPVEMYGDGFLGINFHYLQPVLRAKLFDALYGLVSDPKLTDKAKIKLSYQMLRGFSRYKYFQPCLKRYLYSQFRSKFVYVSPDTWDIALFLPTENFQGATKNQVWMDTRNAV